MTLALQYQELHFGRIPMRAPTRASASPKRDYHVRVTIKTDADSRVTENFIVSAKSNGDAINRARCRLISSGYRREFATFQYRAVLLQLQGA
jgi:hypothetical protein